MNIVDRIEQAPVCEVNNLSDAEKEIFNGSGWKLARFVDVDDFLVELFDPMEIEYPEPNSDLI